MWFTVHPPALLRLLRQGSSRFTLEFAAIVALSGVANAGLLAIINGAADQAANAPAHGRYLAFFLVVLPTFIVAQDMDLWLRLFELGACLTQADVLYRTCYTADGIPGRLRDRQLEFAQLAVACARQRRAGKAEPALPEASGAWRRVAAQGSRRQQADFHYFLGACLAGSDRRESLRQFLSAVRMQPMHLKAWWRLARGVLRGVVPR